MKFDTRAVHVGEEPNFAPGGTGDVVMPIHLASTFARAEIDAPTAGYEYSRSGNPTRDGLERRLAALEDGRHALAFASGLAAETAVVLSLLRPGDHVVLFDDLYGGSRRLFTKVFSEQWGLSITFVDATDPARVAEAMRSETRMIWLETPTNPLLKLCDIEAICDLAQRKNCLVAVDNTFMTPAFQRPLALGADLVVHSTTKYLNGHSDSVGGAVIVSDEGLHERLRFHQNAAGAVLSPFDSFLVLRGLKTLGVRMRAHQDNAARIAAWLSERSEVSRVVYPGLDSHPQHDLAARQMSGFGGMVSFELTHGLTAARVVLESLKIFALAESLGGVESLVESPALMTHASVPAEARRDIGLADGLIRLSVGIEDREDLLADLDHALRKTHP
jgi:cystathionine gamma-lyase